GVLGRLARPAANAIAKRTGIPAATVTRAVDILVPVVLAVMTKRAAAKKSGGATADGLGDLLGGPRK
ncbi:hypothetical protein ACFV0D_34125, partial [Streptomyces sp. NPDC059556]